MKNISKVAFSWLEIPSSERRAILVLIPFFTLASIFLSWMEDRPEAPLVLNENDQAVLDSLIADDRAPKIILDKDIQPQKGDKTTRFHSKRKSKSKIEYFTFNPNSLSKQEFLKLGINAGQFQSIRKWIDNYGELKCKSEFGKLYVIDSVCYARLEPYIDLPSCRQKKKKPVEIFDLNQCDTTMLKSVSGIGPKLSNRIIKYRDLLGGFVSMNQIKEVYGLDDIVISNVLNASKLEKKAISLNVNTSSIEELEMHPYISRKIAKAIVKYREQHGIYKSVIELNNIHLISDSLFLKIEPYLHSSNGITSKSSKSN